MRFRATTFAFVLAAAAAGEVLAQTPPSTRQAEKADMSERTFRLIHLDPKDAAALVAPYLHPPFASVYEAGSIRAITVRETAATLLRVEALLKEYDRAPETVILRFQLIAAESTQSRDPAIAAVESQLRTLFRFPGYRLLSEATAMAGIYSDFQLLIPAGEERLQLTGSVGSVNAGQPDPSIQLRVSLERPTPVVEKGTGHVMAGGLLGTRLTIPLGQTVVMGSTTPGGSIQALILVVRPEIATPKK